MRGMEIRLREFLILSFLLQTIRPPNSDGASTTTGRQKRIGTGIRRIPRAVKVPIITPLQFYYNTYYYNPFWYGGPLDGGDKFDGPFGGFAPNPFARPTKPPKSDKSTASKSEDSDAHASNSMTTGRPVAAAASITPSTVAAQDPGHGYYAYHNSHNFDNYYAVPWDEYD